MQTPNRGRQARPVVKCFLLGVGGGGRRDKGRWSGGTCSVSVARMPEGKSAEDRESTVCSNLKEKVRNKVVCRGREPGERGVLEGVPSL